MSQMTDFSSNEIRLMEQGFKNHYSYPSGDSEGMKEFREITDAVKKEGKQNRTTHVGNRVTLWVKDA